MKILRQSSTATIAAGPFLDPLDGVTPVTGLADQSSSSRLIKNGTGGSFTAASWAHDGNGHYLVGLGAGDTDTLGRLRLDFSSPGSYVPVWEDFEVLSANVFDSLVAASASLTVNLAPVEGSGFTSGQDDLHSIRTAINSILVDVSPSDIAAAVWDELIVGHLTAGTTGKALSILAPQGTRQITLHVQDQNSIPVPNVYVAIYDSSNTTLLYVVQTGSNGNVVFNLNDGTYKFRPIKVGYTFTTPQTVVVTGDATVNVAATAFQPPVPSAPDMCVIFGTLVNAHGTPDQGAVITIRSAVPNAAAGETLVDNAPPITITTDANGQFSIELIKGAKVKIYSPEAGLGGVMFTVPQQASQDFATWAPG